MKKIKIGIIGLGGVARGRHITELLECDGAEIATICDINEKALADVRAKLGLDSKKCYTDYRDLIADTDVEAVEICTPNYLHAEMAKAVLAAGKPVNLEKPVAMNLAEAQSIVEAEHRSTAFGMTCFTYRFMPAVRYAKVLVGDGMIGDIIGLNVAYLKNSAFWEGRRLEWRFQRQYAGSGVIGDLGVHLIDLAQLLAGDITDLTAVRGITVKERTTLDGSSVGAVETDDSCSFMADFACGASGTFHITRCAIGHANTIRYDVYGTRGAISFDLNDPSVLTVAVGEGDPRGYKPETVTVPKEYYLTQEQAFVNAINGERDGLFPTLTDGAESQRVIDALIESSDRRAWVKVR